LKAVVINDIKRSLPRTIELSATLGDIESKPGFASLAAYGLSTLGVDYIKAGLNVKVRSEAEDLARSILKATFDSDCRVILAGYGDYKNIKTLAPETITEIAHAIGADGVMIDTFYKNEKTLFDYLSMRRLKRFVDKGQGYGLLVALAGSIRLDHIPHLKEIGPDIIGVRGAVCTDNDRNGGRIKGEKVKDFKRCLNE
jgi:uncharacterized protein (UPF0264 family)